MEDSKRRPEPCTNAPESQGIEQCFEATELGVPILGEHPVQVLTIQFGDLGERMS